MEHFRSYGGIAYLMRLDKYLKVSRIMKRCTVANEACDGGRVAVNGKIAKAGAEIREGDVIEIRFGENLHSYKVTSVVEHAPKADAAGMYEILS